MPQANTQNEQEPNLRPDAGTASAVSGNPSAEGNKGNLAFTNPDEYKHKHGEHKDGEHHHHHHHHHRHHHRHFHLFDISISGIRDNLKLLFKSIYTYPYMLLALSFVFLFIMQSGLLLSQLNAHKGSFSSPETFYRWQEFLVMHKMDLPSIPFQFTLVVSLGIVLFLMHQQERHWQRNVLKILPALGAAALFSLPAIGKPAEGFARSACRDCLRQYHAICIEVAEINDGAFPEELPDKPSAAAKYGADHYDYYGAGKKASDEAFILLEDKDENHIADYRYAIRSDGVMLVSKYGGLYEEYIGKSQSSSPKK